MVNASRPTEPFDISTIEADQLEAVEYYSGPSQLPLKYATLDSRCGVLVLWTRRSHFGRQHLISLASDIYQRSSATSEVIRD